MADISKIKIGEGDAVNLKDAAARGDISTLVGSHSVAALGDAAWKDIASAITTTETGLATGKQVYDAIQGIGQALHFVGIATQQEGETELQAVERTFPAAQQTAGAIAICGEKEFICAGNGTGGAMKWNEFGDVSAYETKAHAEATYTPMTRTIAGVDLADNITATEMKTALELKGLAFKDSASGSISTADSGTVSVGKAGDYNVSAQTVDVPDTYNALDVTPAGTVEVTKSSAATASYKKTTGVTVSGATATGEQTPNYTPAGTVSKPNVTASLTLAEGSVATVTDAGTGYSLSAGKIEADSDTKAKFVQEAVVMHVGDTTKSEDAECLYVVAAEKGDAVTASKTWTLTNPTLSGSLPTFGSKDVVIKTGTSVAAELAAAPTFTGSGAVLSAEAVLLDADATVTDAVYTASFSGTAAKVTPSVKTTKSGAVSTGSVTVDSETANVTLSTSAKTVTVS